MDKKISPTIAIAALTLAISLSPAFAGIRKPAPAAKPVPANARTVFQPLYTNSDTAGGQKDLDGYLACYMQDFKVSEPGNKTTDLEDLRYRLSNLFDNAQSVRSTTIVTSAVIHGDTANVMVKSNMAMKLTNPDNQQKVVLLDRIVSKDSWVHSDDDGWMLEKSQIISEQNTANGHLVADKSDPFAQPKPKTTQADDTGDNSDNN